MVSPAPGAGITLYGATWCPDCRRSKAFLAAQHIEYDYIDLEEHPEAVSVVLSLNAGSQTIPTIVFPDGSHLSEPTNEELAAKLGLARQAAESTYDVVIIGGGPTGLTAAIYTSREDLRTLVVERSALGGQAGLTDRLDNYPGFPRGISGSGLAERFAHQAGRFGVELLTAMSVASLAASNGVSALTLTSGQAVSAGATLLATGTTYRRTGAPGEADLIGSGIHFCATCDGPFYKGAEEVVVLGGGNSGLEAALLLSTFAKHVTVIDSADTLAASKIIQDKVRTKPTISVLGGTNLVRFNAGTGGHLSSVTLGRPDGTTSDHPAAGAFVFIGMRPNTDWLHGVVALDEHGFITTDRTMSTSLSGVFAAGDVRAGSTKQLASAVGEGAAAALQIRAHLQELQS
jgi:thioredoxin reductase (NADPH)